MEMGIAKVKVFTFKRSGSRLNNCMFHSRLQR